MASAVIGALRVVLGADTAALEKGLKDAQSSLAGFGNHMKMAGAVALGAFSGLAAGVGVAIKQTIDQADKLGKMSQSIGIPVDELSRLKHAADLSDVSIEALGKAVGKLSKNMAEAARDGTSQIGLAFQAVGVAVKNADGTLKSSGQVIQELAGKFGQYKDGAEKTALAIALFGKSGADLIPMLNAGADGMKQMMEEADQLGIVIDTKTAKSAEAFNDNLTRLGKVKDAIILKITAEMVPALQHMSNMLVEAAKNSNYITEAARGITFSLQFITKEALSVGLAFQRLGAEWSALKQMMMATTWEGMKAGWAAFQAAGEETKRQFAELGNFVGKFWQEAGAAAEATAQDTGKKIAAPIVASSAEIKKQAAEAEAALKKILDAGKRTFEETRSPMEQYSLRMQKITEQFNAGAFGADTFARAAGQAQQKMIEANPYAQMLGDSLTTAFDKAIEGGSKFSDILGGLAKDLARMLANQAFKSLLFGPQGGLGGSGLMGSLFGGLKLPGFANGGSFVVGGAGGIDSQIAAMRVTPGERVSVSKDGSGSAGAFNQFNYTVHAPGATQEAMAVAFQEIQRLRADVPGITVSTLKQAKVMTPEVMRR